MSSIEDIKTILSAIEKSPGITLNFETEDLKLNVKKSGLKSCIAEKNTDSLVNLESFEKDQKIIEEEKNVDYIMSPMVGVFYGLSHLASHANSIKVADEVVQGQILCIIEALNEEHELECQVDGTVVEIFVKDNESVEYGQKLFKIKKK